LINKTIATFFYTGYFPLAPGTFSSLVGLILWYLIPSLLTKLLIFPLIIISGFYTSNKYAQIVQKKDPSQVVIDEITGLWITLILVELFTTPSLKLLLSGFILFRALDIIKPYPISKLETFKGSSGIMLDDIGAGLIAGAILIIIQSI